MRSVVNPVLTYKRIDKHTHPDIPELESGFVRWVKRLVCLSVSSRENRWCIQRIYEAVRRCMPCRNPNCDHGWTYVDYEDGSGFYAKRTCAPADQYAFGSVAMIDQVRSTDRLLCCDLMLIHGLVQHEASANAFATLGMGYRLCLFHMVSCTMISALRGMCVDSTTAVDRTRLSSSTCSSSS